MAEEEQKKGEGKGFAGLSSFVSDVDTPPPPAATSEPSVVAPSAERPASPQPAQPQPGQRPTLQEPPQPSPGSSGGKWMLGIAAVVGVFWLIGQSDKATTSPAPAYSPPAQGTAQSYSPPVQSTTQSYSPPKQQSTPSRPTESKPPVGQGNLFSIAQIRYCVAEEIRIGKAETVIDLYSDSSVNRFNAMVSDYNSRCSRFRYRGNDLEVARKSIEPHREIIEAEGVLIISRNLQINYSGIHSTSFDCPKITTISEYLICHTPELAQQDLELAELFDYAKSAVHDKEAFAERTRRQWNYRDKNCNDKNCVAAWFYHQKFVLHKIGETGDVDSQGPEAVPIWAHIENDRVYETSFDCKKINTIPEYLICHNNELSIRDRSLANIYSDVKSAVSDKDAFVQRARRQWNYREKNCRDLECMRAWYSHQEIVFRKIIATGDVNAQYE